MNGCELILSAEIEQYFYGELENVDRARVEAHLRRCEPCRRRLEDLHSIRRALAGRPLVDSPPAGDWSGFMCRLDAAVEPRTRRSSDSGHSAALLRPAAALAAMLAVAVLGVFMAARIRHEMSPQPTSKAAINSSRGPTVSPDNARTPTVPADNTRALRQASAEHLERSKLVVLGLTALDPKRTRAADWQYERQLAGTLLDDTRLYRQAAQEYGMTEVARVMRDLETVLIETSMSDASDRDALSRVQRLIAKRDLVVKMQLVAAN